MNNRNRIKLDPARTAPKRTAAPAPDPSSYKIQSSVPVPPPRVNHLYPFKGMKVGDSFGFEVIKRASVDKRARIFAKKNGVKFTIRMTGDDCPRIWRIK